MSDCDSSKWVYLDINDQYLLGAVLRNCLVFGFYNVILSSDTTVTPLANKCSVGSVELLSFYRFTSDKLRHTIY